MRVRLAALLIGLVLLGLLVLTLMTKGPDGAGVTPDAAEVANGAVPLHLAADDLAPASAEPLVRDALADPVGGAPLPSWTTPPDRDHDLHGVVLGPNEERIPGAEIVVRRAWSRDVSSLDLEYYARSTVVAETRSSAQGEFRVPLPLHGLYDLDVRADALVAPLIRECRAGEFVEVRLKPAAILHGTITALDDGAPLPGLQIRVFRLGGTGRFDDTRTGADGGYRFEGLADGEWILEVIAAAHESPSWTRVTLTPGEEAERSFALPAGRTLRGLVLDAGTRLPIAGAVVSDSWTFRRRSAATGADGRFEVRGLDLDGNWAELHVRAPGYGTRTFHPQGLDSERALELELLPATSMRGLLLAADGSPAAGAYLALIGQRGAAMDWCTATVDERGAFVVNDVSAEGVHFLFARLDGNGSLYARPEGIVGGNVLELGTLHLPPASSLAGQVALARGAPAAALELHGPDLRATPLALDPSVPPGRYVLIRRQRTDDLGRFHFADLCAGEYELRIRVAGSPDVLRQVSLGAGQDLTLPLVDLGDGLTISGRVVDPTGAPLEGARVTLDLPGQPREVSVRTDAAGAFRFDRLLPGEHRLMVSPGHASADAAESWMPINDLVVQAGDTALVVTLQRAAWIHGTVVSGGTWEAASCEILARDAAGEVIGGAYAEESGEFRLRVPDGAIVRLEFLPRRQDGERSDGRIRVAVAEAPVAVLESVPAGASGLRVIL